ncbi:hypothetical protein [Planomicrobium sp. YIM 101495]|uniref:hypothetical protein n=1 Tax=Planomicrobium sp. YIM 101495 TaxID=2665160 RepID=UPI0012B8A8E8|nr:hypothetical protein [Planomicrobium sp. YIM 101495]MTD30126.1 hypothetical protein [Planomicrobium sp. YIM 101495]
MAEINQYGYQKIREFVIANWKYLELRKPDGTVLKRFGIADGLEIAGSANTPTIEYKLIIKGSDALFTNQTVGKSVVFDSPTGANAITTENFTSFTFESADDELTIIHKLQIPQVL